jgi:hypothetical protein
MICERTLRHSGRCTDIAHAPAVITGSKHDAQSGLQDFVA